MFRDPSGSSAPTYVVEVMSEMNVQYLTESILIIDFGQSFFLRSPPHDGVGTPMGYCAPEVTFDLKASACSDKWALACTIFESGAGQALFKAFSSTPEEVVTQIVQTLGRLPENWCGMRGRQPGNRVGERHTISDFGSSNRSHQGYWQGETAEYGVDYDSTKGTQNDGDDPGRHPDMKARYYREAEEQ
ncbi:MAG: hypothetical protein M1830_008708 [Pleopsidium flavum]|nr:MAG: hypothetical protein M1830_008708 [Pleopsidium flavum]